MPNNGIIDADLHFAHCVILFIVLQKVMTITVGSDLLGITYSL